MRPNSSFALDGDYPTNVFGQVIIPEANFIVLIGQVSVCGSQGSISLSTIIVKIFYNSRGSSHILKAVIN